MNSMTGFGRSELEENGHKIAVEIRSVNHRFLDINVRMPRFLLFLEEEARTRLKNRLVRGRVDVFVSYTSVGERKKSARVDMGMVEGYLSAAAQIAGRTGMQSQLSMAELIAIDGIVTFEEEACDEEALRHLFGRVVDTGLEQLVAARSAEGARISGDMRMRAALLEEIVTEITGREPLVVEEYAAKLRTRLEEIAHDTDIDENRLNAEILLFADRCSITEELVRLRSHIAQLKTTLCTSEASGRNLDFLIQELNREFNTIGSKASDIAITKAVLTAKGEVEKIREQVQNIE